MRYQFYFCWSPVSPKGTSFRLRMLLLWCCQGIPGTPAFSRAGASRRWLVFAMQSYFSNVRGYYIQEDVQNHSKGKKNTAVPVPSLVHLEQGTHTRMEIFVLFLNFLSPLCLFSSGLLWALRWILGLNSWFDALNGTVKVLLVLSFASFFIF